MVLSPRPLSFVVALNYLERVENAFGGRSAAEYNEFLNILQEFRSMKYATSDSSYSTLSSLFDDLPAWLARLDADSTLDRAVTLFKGKPDLIIGFRTFCRPIINSSARMMIRDAP